MASNDTKTCFALSMTGCDLNKTNETISVSVYDLSIEETRLLGIICMTILVICFLAYIPVIWIFMSRQQFIKHLSFQIIIQIGVMEIFFQFCYVQMCLMMIFNIDFGPIVGKLNMACRTFAWLSLHLLTLILALNRSDSLVDFLGYFNNKKNQLFKFLLAFTYSLSFLILVLYLIPGFQAETRGLKTIRDEYNRVYLATNIQRVGIFLDSLSFVLYVVAVIKLIIMRCKTSGNKLISGPELSLSIQAFIICSYKTFVILLWQFYVPPTRFIYCACYVLTIFEISYNPFMYFMFIRKLRVELFTLWKKSLKFISISVVKISVVPSNHPIPGV